METRWWLWLALISPALANSNSGGAQVLDNPRITVRVVNSPVVPVKTLVEAEKMASRIFARARVAVRWVDGPSDEPREPTDFKLYLVKGKPARGSGDMTGFAILTPRRQGGEDYGAVSYPAIEAAAQNLEVDVSSLLGATLAHEIGHLLLGAASHSASGIMCPRLGRKQMRSAARGELLFTPGQAVEVHTEAARRMAQ